MTYTVMTLQEAVFQIYGNAGELFSAERDGLMALIWKRILACLERFLQALADVMGLDADRLIEGADGG